MASRYDDELWERVPERPGAPPAHLARFVKGLGHVGDALDLGCGDGRLGAALDAAALTVADVSAVALARAARRLPAAAAVELEPDAPLPFVQQEHCGGGKKRKKNWRHDQVACPAFHHSGSSPSTWSRISWATAWT